MLLASPDNKQPTLTSHHSVPFLLRRKQGVWGWVILVD